MNPNEKKEECIMVSLRNEYLHLAVNAQGCITHLENLKTGYGNVIADQAPVPFDAAHRHQL